MNKPGAEERAVYTYVMQEVCVECPGAREVTIQTWGSRQTPRGNTEAGTL